MHIPALLAGPIIRRTEHNRVCIWVATNDDYDINADFYQINTQRKTAYKPIKTDTQTETMKLGKKLYIHLISVTPLGRNFPSGTLIGYNLNFFNNAQTFDLGTLGLLDAQNPHSIVYGDLELPSFFIDQDNEKRNTVLYGSCRKPHSEGDDALVSADVQTEETHINMEKRPSALFLLGDQIYADDIPDPLASFIFDLSKEMVGEEELGLLDNRLKLDPFVSSIDLIHGRQFIVNHFAKFTSNHAANHLMQLGEYSIMYLLSFSPDLWEVADDYGIYHSFEYKYEKEKLYFVYPDRDCYREEYKKEYEQFRARYINQLKQIYRFQENLYRVRRLLANTPTYMIFDDHDITDDWNLTIDWKNNVSESPLGRHIVANGLGAYWAFQGWGNDPDAFNKGFKIKMQKHFNQLDPQSPSYDDYVDILWDFDRWHFVTPTSPKAIFLDTRTMRGYDPSPKPTKIGSLIEENIRSPQLINETGWEKMTDALQKANWNRGDHLLVISPTPLYGIGLIESVLHNYVYPLRVLGVSVQSMLDFEAWKYNEQGYHAFLRWLENLEPRNCFILSGDVHYASSVHATVAFPNQTNLNIYQFTSSPMSNMSFTGFWGFLMQKVVWLNALKRKKITIHRHCNEDGHLVYEGKDQACPSNFLWRENIQYLSMDNGAIIETDNNIGLLEWNHSIVQHKLLQYYEVYKHEKFFEALELD
ncbi:hypothetical protein NC661_12560 [Aquibacillus koreensis]|uniref:PhoD-like phosphatase metallophosphatase domain-containing protein n=1 Tax=Aquibacillus koreensis TaxID=279446 RepID=A0A9X3WM87_9BACI|nr:hypothetical protein [Aquibacillus koreensis]MCT2537763.1 hypothetical protein [Aquibacillus koreensis]MDC3421203.1 hypothetical protein [Aquibacillus koreensis]